MKTGMEILKEIRRLAVVEGQKAYSGPGVYSSGQASGLRVSGDLLQAWLREAEEWVEEAHLKSMHHGGIVWYAKENILRNLLGTTQEGK